jgi:hypothetical protein
VRDSVTAAARVVRAVEATPHLGGELSLLIGITGRKGVATLALQSPDHLPRFLDTIDDHGHAAVSINNPDTATRNATYVPGTGQDLARLQYSTEKSEQMYWAAREADRSLKPGDVSVTTWMGYDRPMNVITDAPSTSYAHNGAQALDDFQAGERASHDNAHFGQIHQHRNRA